MIDAEYLLLHTQVGLTQYRVFTLGTLLVAQDAGPGQPYTLDVDPTLIDHGDLAGLSADDHPQYILASILTANGDLLYRASGLPDNLPIGSSGDFLRVSSGLPAWQSYTPPTQPHFSFPWQTGWFYGALRSGTAPATQAMAANVLYAVPVFVPTASAVDQLYARQTGAGAAHYHIGIYGPITQSLASLPLLYDSGQLTTAAAADLTANPNQTLQPGWYFLVILSDGTLTMRAVAAAEVLVTLGADDNSSAQQNMLLAATSYGALPNPGPSSWSKATITNLHVTLRCA